MKKLILLWLTISFTMTAQQPQTQTSPIYAVNSKYVNGVAPGYWPTQQPVGSQPAASGLNINVGPGTANCGSGSIASYGGGTFTLTPSTTTYVYLNTSASCVPAIKTTSFSGSDIPIATIVTGSSSLTSIADDRTPFQVSSGGGGGADSVQYNPVGTAYIFATFSGPYDDNHFLSSAVPVSSYSCASGVCTVNTSSAHNLVPQATNNHNNYVDVTSMSGFGATQQATNNGSFAVASAPTSTQFTFSSSNTASCSSSCGSIYDASYWGLYQTANQPFLYGHGTVYGVETSLGSLDANFSSLVNCSIGSPAYLIIETGQNDLAAGSGSASMLPHYLSVWQKAHAAGCVVIQGSLVSANYSASPASSIWAALLDLNWQFPTYAKSFSNVSTGQYWDRYIDYNAYMASRGSEDKSSLGDTPSGAYEFAQITNHAMSTQSSQVTGPFPMYAQGGRNNEIAFGPLKNAWMFYDQNFDTWMSWSNSGQMTLTQNHSSNGTVVNFIESFNGDTCAAGWGHDIDDGLNSNNSGHLCFHYNSNQSSTNYAYLGLAGSSGKVIIMKGDGTIQFPFLTASSGTKPLQVDTSGNVSVGTGGSYPSPTTVSVTGAASIDLDSCVSSSYTDYEIRIDDIQLSSGTTLYIRFSTNNGSTWDTSTMNSFSRSYSQQGSSAGASQGNNDTSGYDVLQSNGVATSTTHTVNGRLTLHAPLSTTAFKSIYGTVTAPISGSQYTVVTGNEYQNMNAINAVQIIPASGTITGQATCQPMPK